MEVKWKLGIDVGALRKVVELIKRSKEFYLYSMEPLKDGHLATMARQRWQGTDEVALGERPVKGGGITK